jgi:mannose-1-phosphate guanylyltransferase
VRFVEKPDRERAEAFVAAGMRWNAGMFVVRAAVLLDELAVQIPGLAAGAREIAAAHGTDAEQEVLERVWPSMTAIAIDHALAEPLAARGRVAMVPAEFDWDDVGDFAALARQLREREGDVRRGEDGTEVHVVGSASVDALSSRATVYGSTDRHIALVGLQGISVVDTEDALLVLADERAQDLQRLVGRLDEQGLERLR